MLKLEKLSQLGLDDKKLPALIWKMCGRLEIIILDKVAVVIGNMRKDSFCLDPKM